MITESDAVDEKFNYDQNLSYNVNYALWFTLMSYERDAYGEQPASPAEARAIFDELYSEYK